MAKDDRKRSAAQAARAARRLRAMYDRLVDRFGPQQWWPAKTAFEVVIGAYLTQNTAWKSVEKSIANLEARGVLSVAGLRAIPEEGLRSLIRPSGFMLRKAAALRAFVAFLDEEYAGALENLQQAARHSPHQIRRELLALPGVGPETADAILLYALDAPAMVVDEYLRRIVTRHGLVPEKAKYAAIQTLAEQAFAPEQFGENPTELARHYNEFHALVVQIGKLHCGRAARCEGCPLAFDPHRPQQEKKPA
ncbi:MAG TPA: base excision DNA repair protein [Acidobacteriaceae bacterium]|jgi:endonuclease-3 related protein|nr:base excision DNA repair protein [Acidobacteriaceae bacterium]